MCVEQSITLSEVHTMWCGGRYLSGPWGYLLGSQGAVNGAMYHTEWSTHHVMCWALPLRSVRVPLGSTRCILPGTQMVYGAKYHTERSAHHMMWGALPLGSMGVPLGSTNRILLGTQIVYRAKYTGAKYTPRNVVGVPLESAGIPLESITLRPRSHVLMFTCFHVLLISVLNWTQYTISTIPIIIMSGAYVI